jgi:predicted transcriptional regulator
MYENRIAEGRKSNKNWMICEAIKMYYEHEKGKKK